MISVVNGFYFHVTPESANANYKTWIATTGMDSYIKIEQTGSDKFKVTDVYRELNGKSLEKRVGTGILVVEM